MQNSLETLRRVNFLSGLMARRPSSLRHARAAESAAIILRAAEDIPVMIYALDRRGLVALWNREAERVTGYSKAKMLGRPEAPQLLYPDEKYRKWVLNLAMRAQGEVRNMVLNVTTADGSVRVVSWTDISHTYPVEGWSSWGVGVDITRQVEAQKALRRSEDDLRRILDGAPMSINVAQDGHLVYINQETARMLGRTTEELLGRDMTEFIHPEDAPLVAERHQRRSQGESLPGVYSFRLLAADGSQVWAELRTVRIDWDGRPATLNFMVDITQRLHQETTLQEDARRLSSIVENLPFGAVLRDGDELHLNQAVEDITGFSRGELAGVEDWFGKLFDQRGPRLRRLYERGRKQAMRTPITVHLVRADGQKRLVSFYGGLLQDAELWVLTDVTEAVKAKREKAGLERKLRQSRKMEALGTLAGGIAHDFNNVLAAMVGYTELAQEAVEEGANPSPELANVLRAAQRASQLIQQILTFSRRAETEMRPMDLNHEVEQTAALLRRTMPLTIDIELDLAPDLPRIRADAAQLDQVILNLAHNAKDSMPSGGKLSFHTSPAHVEALDAELELEPGAYVRLEVADTGEGIDPKAKAHIYDPFFTTKELGKGTGLGLSTVYGVVKSHHGRIDCESKPGRGSVFSILLPADREAARPEDRDTDQPGQAADWLQGGGRLILLVDDEPQLVDIGRRILTRAGFTVAAALDGNQALELFQERHEDIAAVVLDVNMPSMDGLECLRRMRAVDPSVKVIIASGYAPRRHKADIIELGVSDYIAKPYGRRQLLTALANTFGQS